MGNKNSTDACIFCNILNQKVYVIMDNQEFFAFHDISKGSAVEHVLISTKKHIKNAYELETEQEMYRMRQFGTKVLDRICDQKNRSQRSYKFGFHLPPYNSVHHIHLHCFVEPFSNHFYRLFHYGYMIHSVEETAAKWRQRRANL